VRKSLKHLASLILIPVVNWYLRKERQYTFKKIKIRVKPGVFHPGFFSSTKFVLSFLDGQNLHQKSFLELGCGSGLIAVYAAKKGAVVTATDVNPAAVENTRQNSALNLSVVNTVLSDLFENIPAQLFDWIVINPPYYAQAPKNDPEKAWYCGKDFEYFSGLFASVEKFCHENTSLIMVLTKGCDVNRITDIARKAGFAFHLIAEKNVLFDGKDFLFKIQKINAAA
jgi:release factor glutamine methyltransferase